MIINRLNALNYGCIDSINLITVISTILQYGFWLKLLKFAKNGQTVKKNFVLYIVGNQSIIKNFVKFAKKNVQNACFFKKSPYLCVNQTRLNSYFLKRN